MAQYRVSDPALGRWLQVDPVEKYHESGYAWVTNNPIRFMDYLGLDTVDVNSDGPVHIDDVIQLDDVVVTAERPQQEDDSDQDSENDEGNRTSKVAQAIPIAIGSAAVDGPIPVGDAVAVVIIAGALVWDLLENPTTTVIPIHNPDAIHYTKGGKKTVWPDEYGDPPAVEDVDWSKSDSELANEYSKANNDSKRGPTSANNRAKKHLRDKRPKK